MLILPLLLLTTKSHNPKSSLNVIIASQLEKDDLCLRVTRPLRHMYMEFLFTIWSFIEILTIIFEIECSNVQKSIEVNAFKTLCSSFPLRTEALPTQLKSRVLTSPQTQLALQLPREEFQWGFTPSVNCGSNPQARPRRASLTHGLLASL